MWNEVVSQPLIPSELSASFENDSKKKDRLRKGFCIVPCTRRRCTRLAGRRWTGWDQMAYQQPWRYSGCKAYNSATLGHFQYQWLQWNVAEVCLRTLPSRSHLLLVPPECRNFRWSFRPVLYVRNTPHVSSSFSPPLQSFLMAS